jgi:hypothetical protein
MIAFLSVVLLLGAVASTAPVACGVTVRTNAPANASELDALRKSQTPDDVYRLALAYAIGSVIAQDCRKASDLMLKAASAGLAPAQNALGEIVEAQNGPSHSDKDAAKWYRAAYEHGDPRGTYNLGRLIAEGRAGAPTQVADAHAGPAFSGADVQHSTERDWTAVAALWQTSAAAGDPMAEYALGQLYETGQGVPLDPNRAMALYRQAAAAGVTAAQDRLNALNGT